MALVEMTHLHIGSSYLPGKPNIIVVIFYYAIHHFQMQAISIADTGIARKTTKVLSIVAINSIACSIINNHPGVTNPGAAVVICFQFSVA
ncbi:MAG: hypothetical protein K0Q79_1656 [Flavipsychrobacter sp.]|jgi:hypothetical protein|nr:hypothetical protein [Flavipsychrobacter sp.]